MTYLVLAVIAIALTIISLRWRNVAITLASTLSWFALWAYNLTSPPSGITIGSLIHDVLNYTFLVATIGVMVSYLLNKSRGYTGYPMTAQEQADYNRELKVEPEEPSIMAMSPEQYKSYINRRRTRK